MNVAASVRAEGGYVKELEKSAVFGRGIEIEAPDEEPRRWRVKIPVGKTYLVFRLGANGIQLDLGKTPLDARCIRGALFSGALHEAGLWFKELGERNRDTQAARKSSGDDGE